MLCPPQVELEEVDCPLGCLPHDQTVVIGRDRIHHLPGEFSVVRCQTCGLMRTNPRPTAATIGFYYPDSYSPYQSTQITLTATPQSPDRVWKRLIRHVFNKDSKHLPPLQPGRLLEIGCASGCFLHQMAQRGWQVAGVELSEKAGEMARSLGYAVHAGALATAPEPTEPYDLVVGWMVLEHLHDPIQALQLLQRWTKSGGWLVLSVPDAGSVEFRIFKDAWYGLHLPNHLYHYTRQTLTSVLERGGWKLERVFWHHNSRNLLEGLRYRCIDRGWETAEHYVLAVIKKRRQRTARAVLGKCLGMLHASGRMTVWARRA